MWKHHADVDNHVVDALSCRMDLLLVVVIDKDQTANALYQRVDLLLAVSTKITGFEKLKDDYDDCSNFEKILSSL